MPLAEVAVVCGASCVVSAIFGAVRVYEAARLRRFEDAARHQATALDEASRAAAETRATAIAAAARCEALEGRTKALEGAVGEVNTRVGNLAFRVQR